MSATPDDTTNKGGESTAAEVSSPSTAAGASQSLVSLNFKASAGAAGERMALLLRQNRRILHDTHKYTRFVQYMRVILPLMALVIIVLLLLWPQFGGKTNYVTSVSVLDNPDFEKDVQENRLVTARYENVDSKNRPYVIEAEEATQNQDNPDLIMLKFPKATLTQTDLSKVFIQSMDGLYRQESQTLNLSGSVYFTRSDGYTLKTDKISGNIKQGSAKTDEPVFIEGPAGTLDATGMRIENEGSRVIFTGPVLMRLYSESSIVPTSTPAQNSVGQNSVGGP